MIQAAELRTGNLVIWNPKLRNPDITLPAMEIEISSVTGENVVYVFPNIEQRVEPFEDDVVQMGERSKPLKELEPIMLTTEVLEKSGFNKQDENKYVGHDDVTIIVAGNKFIYQQDSSTKNEIESLHQLQNLYFNLTGEVLEVIM